MAVCKEEVSPEQERSFSLLQEEPEPPHIKEEQEEQLQRREGPGGSMLTLPAVKSEDGAEDISSHYCEVEVELESDPEVNEDSDDCEETSGAILNMVVCKEEDLLQEEPEPPHIKEEQEELKEEILQRPEEPVESEDGDEDVSSHYSEVELESDTEVTEDGEDLEETSEGVRSQSSLSQSFRCPHPDCMFSLTSYDLLHVHIKFSHAELFHQMMRNGQITSAASRRQITNSVTSQKLGDTDEPSDDWEYWTQQETTSGGVISQSSQAQAFLHKHVERSHNIHTGERPYNCEHCDRSFIRSYNLKIHQRIHNGEKPHRCEHCDNSFKLPYQLKRHQSIHTGEKPHRCEHCDKSFFQLSHLQRHQSVHAHRCEHCDKSFYHAASLKVHQRIHTGEKPYNCEHCDKGFNRLDYLKTHQRVHTGKKPFQCKHCDKSFRQTSHLNTHQRVHNKKSFTPSEIDKEIK